MIRFLLPILLAALFTASCSDTGTGSGSSSIPGAGTVSMKVGGQDWSAQGIGVRSGSGAARMFTCYAILMNTSSAQDILYLQVYVAGSNETLPTGTYNVNEVLTPTLPYARIIFLRSSTGTGNNQWVAQDGRIVVTKYGDGVMQGTFRGTLKLDNSTQTMSVSDGGFNCPVTN